MSSFECAMMVPRELEFLKNLVISIKKKLEEEDTRQIAPLAVEVTATTAAMLSGVAEENQVRTDANTTLRPIMYVKGTDRRLKSLLLNVNIGDTYVNGQMDTRASMSIMSKDTTRELGLLKEVIGEESYRQHLGQLERRWGG